MFNPDAFVGEIRRVVRVGGIAIISVPFVWDEHEQPHDFARYSSYGLRSLLERNGFEVTSQRKLLADFSVVCQMLNGYLFEVTQDRGRLTKAALIAFVMGPVSIAGRLLATALPRNEDLFLDQVFVAVRRT